MLGPPPRTGTAHGVLAALPEARGSRWVWGPALPGEARAASSSFLPRSSSETPHVSYPGLLLCCPVGADGPFPSPAWSHHNTGTPPTPAPPAARGLSGGPGRGCQGSMAGACSGSVGARASGPSGDVVTDPKRMVTPSLNFRHFTLRYLSFQIFLGSLPIGSHALHPKGPSRPRAGPVGGSLRVAIVWTSRFPPAHSRGFQSTCCPIVQSGAQPLLP